MSIRDYQTEIEIDTITNIEEQLKQMQKRLKMLQIEFEELVAIKKTQLNK